jgi:6-phosphogluconolactonase (cycloisomerase 2 family)
MRTTATGARIALLPALLLALAGCGGGGGKDRSFHLPPGDQVDTQRSGQVLVVVEASNECVSHGNCAAPLPGPSRTPGGVAGGCDVGAGNTRGLAVYRLGTNGLLFDDPSTPQSPEGPEQTIATADNPRRLVVHPNDPSLLYVATKIRIQVFRLGAGGTTRCIGQTKSEHEIDPSISDDLDPVDLAIDPTIGNGVLYVADRGVGRIDAFAIAADGTLPEVPTSCAIGSANDEFAAVAPLTADFIAVGGHSVVDIYRRVDGQFPPPTPAPSATPSPSPSPGLECTGGHLLTIPASSIGAALVTDILFAPSSSTPIGNLFLGEEVSQRVLTFPIDASGILSDSENSKTNPVGIYQYLLRTSPSPDAVLYASVFDQGRVDVFRLENGLLPDKTFSRTAEDPDTLPVALAFAPGNLLYVAQGGIGRVDAFRIQSDGGVEAMPATSTVPIQNATGDVLDTFPNDLAIVALP